MPKTKKSNAGDLFIPKKLKREYNRAALYRSVKEAREEYINNNFDEPEECDIPEIKPLNHYPDKFFQEAADIEYASLDRVWNDESDDSRDGAMIDYLEKLSKLIKKYA